LNTSWYVRLSFIMSRGHPWTEEGSKTSRDFRLPFIIARGLPWFMEASCMENVHI
jgi:hypothetical protein